MRVGSIAHKRCDPVAALTAYQQVAALAPDFHGIDGLLADQLCYVGRVDDSITAFDRAIANDPSQAFRQNRLFCLNYSDRLTPAQLANEHRSWGSAVEARVAPLPRRPIRHRSSLRVGYVSPDLRDHPVASFLAPLLKHHDRARFQVTCFDTSPGAEDEVTAELRTYASDWHRVGKLSDELLAAKIREHEMDILVDLSGHTRHNRLEVFARQPAPVQVTWLGYLGTTGLSRMNYRLTDATMDPPGLTDSLYTERLVRLPLHACFAPSADAPVPAPVPRGAQRTFGSVNQWPKVSPATRDTWARLLIANPDARLRVIARGGHTAGMGELIKNEFARRGARAEQIETAPFMPKPQFLEFLTGIDVALDPWPYGGGTTTFQCLWMGIPVVTLAGATAPSRNSIGPLANLGLENLVAGSPDDYIDIATQTLANRPWLAELRVSLRDEISRSPLNDGSAFARSVEAAFEAMWRDLG